MAECKVEVHPAVGNQTSALKWWKQGENTHQLLLPNPNGTPASHTIDTVDDIALVNPDVKAKLLFGTQTIPIHSSYTYRETVRIIIDDSAALYGGAGNDLLGLNSQTLVYPKSLITPRTDTLSWAQAEYGSNYEVKLINTVTDQVVAREQTSTNTLNISTMNLEGGGLYQLHVRPVDYPHLEPYLLGLRVLLPSEWETAQRIWHEKLDTCHIPDSQKQNYPIELSDTIHDSGDYGQLWLDKAQCLKQLAGDDDWALQLLLAAVYIRLGRFVESKKITQRVLEQVDDDSRESKLAQAIFGTALSLEGWKTSEAGAALQRKAYGGDKAIRLLDLNASLESALIRH